MKTELLNIIEVSKLVTSADENSIITYISYLDSRIRDLDLQLRQIHNCCEITTQRKDILITTLNKEA